MAVKNENNVLKWALKYQAMGWSIIPIRQGTKQPAIRSWKPYQTKKPEIEQIRQWFSTGDNSIAVILGAVSGGLTCRDFDEMAEYEKWAQDNPKLAESLPTVETARGMHVYFLSDCKGTKHIENGELRGKGGYCLAPPSVHPDGVLYRWKIPLNGNLQRLDPQEAGFTKDYTLHTLQTVHTKQYRDRDRDNLFDKDKAFIKNSIDKTIPEKNGQRNRKIFDFAFSLKNNPELRTVEPTAFLNIVKEWHHKALPYIKTKDFLETWNDFLKAWKKIEFYGVDYMEAYQQSLNLKPSDYIVENYSQYKELVKLDAFCRALDKACNGKGFVLDCRKAGEIIGISFRTANTYLNLLCNIKVMEILEKGKYSPNPKIRKATKYKYLWEN